VVDLLAIIGQRQQDAGIADIRPAGEVQRGAAEMRWKAQMQKLSSKNSRSGLITASSSQRPCSLVSTRLSTSLPARR